MAALKNVHSTETPVNQIQPREDNNVIEIDLVELFWELFNHVGEILICMILGAMLAFFPTWFLITPQYKSTAKIYIVSASNDSVINLTDLQIGSQLTSDYKELIKSYPMMNEVTENLKLNMDAAALSAKVTVSNPNDTRIIAVTVSDPNPNTAAKIANEIVTLSLRVLPEIMESESPNIAEYARPAESPYTPSYAKNTVIGALAGTVLACGVIVVRMLLNDTFTSADDFVRVLGTNPLAVVPEMSGFASGSRGGYNSYNPYNKKKVQKGGYNKNGHKKNKTTSSQTASANSGQRVETVTPVSEKKQKGDE